MCVSNTEGRGNLPMGAKIVNNPSQIGRSDRSCSDVSVAALIGNAFRDSADRKTHVTIARAGARFS